MLVFPPRSVCTLGACQRPPPPRETSRPKSMRADLDHIGCWHQRSSLTCLSCQEVAQDVVRCAKELDKCPLTDKVYLHSNRSFPGARRVPVHTLPRFCGSSMSRANASQESGSWYNLVLSLPPCLGTSQWKRSYPCRLPEVVTDKPVFTPE